MAYITDPKQVNAIDKQVANDIWLFDLLCGPVIEPDVIKIDGIRINQSAVYHNNYFILKFENDRPVLDDDHPEDFYLRRKKTIDSAMIDYKKIAETYSQAKMPVPKIKIVLCDQKGKELWSVFANDL